MTDSPLVIFGCGFIGSRVARAGLAAGRHVRVCARGTGRLEPLRALGAEVKYLDASRAKQFGPALQDLRGQPTVVYAIPPVTDLPPGEALHRATQASLNNGVRTFIYLSSAGLYGDHPDEEWVDENTNRVIDDPAMSGYHTDEGSVESASMAGLRTIILRLAAVYGPGRGVRARLRKGDYKLLDEGKHWNSRVHVDDLVAIIFAAEERAPQGSLYLVADDTPTTQLEYARWLCERLHLPLPPSVKSYAPGAPRQLHRGRRIHNTKLKQDLGYTFLYPSFREGEEHNEAAEGVVSAPLSSQTSTGPIVSAALPRPACIQHLSTLKSSAESYPGSTEVLASYTALGEPLGLQRLGVNLVRVAPGQRSSWPHAHSAEEELVYVLEGAPDVWIDGRLHRLGPGDVVGFPAGTGVAHTVINNTAADAVVLCAGERNAAIDRVAYPLDAERRAASVGTRLWNDAPRAAERGDHDGLPDAQRRR